MAEHDTTRSGTISWDNEQNEWVGEIVSDGRSITKRAGHPQDVWEWFQEQIAEDRKVPGITLGDFLDTWLKDIKGWLRPKTIISYEYVIRAYLNPDLGNYQLTELTAEDLQTRYREWLAMGVSKRRVELCHGVLRSALEQAVRMNKVSVNVARLARAPRPDKAYTGRVWSAEQVRRFLAALRMDDDRLEGFFTLEISCGLRMGEILGLHWEDIDLSMRKVRVQRQLQRLPGEGQVESQPKSSSGRRQIELSIPTAEALQKWKCRQDEERAAAGDEWQETPFMFTTPIGTALDDRNIYHFFRKKSKELGLPLIRFHDLRHTCASLLLERGIQPKVVQEILGHSSINITLELYAHVLPSMQEEAAKVMGSLLAE